MNKIYKVIWSKARNCYVVASELAKRHTKSPQCDGIVKASRTAAVSAVIFAGMATCVGISSVNAASEPTFAEPVCGAL